MEERGIDDAATFHSKGNPAKETYPALVANGFSETQVEEILSIVSGVLLLGNVDFDTKSKEAAKVVGFADNDVIVAVAELWRCDPKKLAFCMQHSWKGAKRDIQANYTLEQAPRMRDSFARCDLTLRLSTFLPI